MLPDVMWQASASGFSHGDTPAANARNASWRDKETGARESDAGVVEAAPAVGTSAVLMQARSQRLTSRVGTRTPQIPHVPAATTSSTGALQPTLAVGQRAAL